MDTRTAHALVHFGLGRRGQQPVPSDPVAWLRSQLTQPDPSLSGPARFDPAQTTAAGLGALIYDRTNKTRGKDLRVTAIFLEQSLAQLDHAMTTEAPFRERLVWFWTNHFTISRRQGSCSALAGAYVQEAIRPHVTGRFEDMLLAVMRHPAMLLYLDNVNSYGPDSPAGRRQKRGLNENLARECLELHTVSPAGGYTQADVTTLARIITGWTIDFKADPPGFRFLADAHEPGGQTLMGQAFPPGEEGGIAALRFLANHPSTHRFLATKLATQFVADDPPPDAVRRIEGVLRDTRGDLGAASAAIIDLPGAWQPASKLRTPQEYVVSCYRMLSLSGEDTKQNLFGILRGLGQPFMTAPAPIGWPDRAADWATPAALMQRIDWVTGFAGRVGLRDPMDLAETCLGPLLRQPTRSAMAGAGSRRDAMAMFLTSPEFLRR